MKTQINKQNQPNKQNQSSKQCKIGEGKYANGQTREKKYLLNYDVLKEEISQSNVLAMAELLALSEIRFLVGYMGSKAQRMYADLYADIKHKNDLHHTFSDSYDLAQEGALFLCEYYGKRLNDVIGHDKSGKAITVRIACMRVISKIVGRKSRDCNRNVSLDALTPSTEPSCEIQEEITQDYTTYDTIVESLNLTDNMRIALECRQKGLSYPEIAAILERAQSTVFEYFIKLRQRYVAIYG